MTKISLIAAVLVSLCAVYGQIPVGSGNFDHYDPFYFPYASTFVNQPNGQRNAGTAGQLSGTEMAPTKKNLGQGTVQFRLKQLEANTASLTTQLKETNSRLDQTRSDLFSTQVILADLKSELRITKNEVAMKASQSDLDKTNTNVSNLKADLDAVKTSIAKAATQADLDQTNADVSNLNDAMQVINDELATKLTQTDLAQINADISAVQADLDTTKADLATKLTQDDLANINSDISNVQTNIDGIQAELSTKLTQSDIDPIITDVMKLKEDQIATNDALATKLTQADIDPIMADVQNLKDLTSPSTIDAIPASCADLQSIGFVKSGIYSVLVDKQVKNVYCDFTKTDPGLETLIGVVDVKSTAVSFHAQMSTSYSTVDTAVPFDSIQLNVGNAFSPDGVFTAPTPGKYYFAYSGISDSDADGDARVVLQTKAGAGDWTSMGEAFGQAGFKTLSLHSTLELLKDDQVRLLLTEGKISEEPNKFYTNFVGWLVEENELPV